MPIKTFLNGKLYVAQYDLSGNSNEVSLDYGAELKDITVFGQPTRQRIAGLKTIRLSAKGFWEAQAQAAQVPAKPDDALYGSLGLADVPISVGDLAANGDVGFFFKGIEGNYKPGFGQMGDVLPFSFDADSRGLPVIRGQALNLVAQTVTGNNTGVQLGAVSATQKIWAAAHVIAWAGSAAPSLVLRVQSSATQGGAYTTRLTFATTFLGFGSEFAVAVAGPFTDTWWRLDWTITGTTPSFTPIVLAGVQ